MVASVQSQVQSLIARAAAADPSLFKPGQVLEALVLGKAPDGLMAIKIGEMVVNAQLPQSLPAGTTLQLQVKSAGAVLQLAVVGTPQVPVAAPQAVVTRPVLPQGQVVVQTGPSVQHPQSAAVVTAGPRPAPEVVVAAQTQVQTQGALPVQTVSAQPAAQGAPATPAPAVADVVQGARPASGGQIIESHQPVVAPGASVESRVIRAPTAVVVAPERASTGPAPVPVAPASVARPASTPLPQSVQLQAQSSAASSPAPQTGVAVQPVHVAPTLAAAPLPAASAAPVAGTPNVPSPPGPVAPVNVALQVVAHPATAPQAGPVAVAAQPAVQTPAPTVLASPLPEPEAPNPLLIAQAASRPAFGAVESGRPWASVTGSAQMQGQPAAATPAAALAHMVPEAMGRQNSLAPLLASLAALVGRPAAVPEPVLRAAMQLLSQRVPVSAVGPTAETLEGALAKSGVYLEAGLARGTPAPDIKSALVALKVAAATWLGGNPAPVTGTQQPAPPLRGLPPRAEAPELPPLPEGAREAVRAIHSQADAALSRVKLMQLASLPDMADPARAAAPELRMEVPFVFGQQLVMAQFQVFRDREHQRSDGKRGWTMRFAMNFAEGGEVGAEVGLLGKSVNVALWAADPETAADLEAALPELTPALAALGLEPGAVRIRSAPAEQPKPVSGHVVDSRR